MNDECKHGYPVDECPICDEDGEDWTAWDCDELCA